MDDKTNISRRQFIGAAGGIAGMATLASLPFDAQATENRPSIAASDFSTEQRNADVLVIGAGMAGLFAAIKAHDAGAKVLMVSKGRLGSSGLTPFAKGIFSYDKDNASISIDEFVNQVSESALHTNNPVFTRQLAEHSFARVAELKEWGFFDSPLCNQSFMRPITARNIALEEHVMITHLLKQDDHVVGASGFSLHDNRVIHYQAKTVIICTGSGGFKGSGFPMCDLTHDGTIMAYKVGAKVTGKEWNDGHPGSAENAADCYGNWHGQIEQKPSITAAQVNHHLGVEMNYLAHTQGGPVVMGPAKHGAQEQGERQARASSEMPAGPYTPEAFRRSGPPPERPERGFIRSLLTREGHQGPPGMGGEQVGGSTAGMAIHKAEGIVPINAQGLSTLPGLYAAGDALGSYMSGGIYTQIGGSLAGSAVQGAIAGEAAAKASLAKKGAINLSKHYLQGIREQILAPLTRKRGYSPAWVTQVLQGVMIPNFVLYIKKERMMQAALAYVEELREHHVPMLMANDRHRLRLAHETENMIITAEMKLKASIMRTESRCSHYRLDYPAIDYKNWNAWINIYQHPQGHMQLEKQDFDKWPAFA